MLGRLNISRDGDQNVHYSLAGPDGSIIANGMVPQEEWDALRSKVIEQYPADGGVDIIDYIVTLCELAGL